MLLTYPEGMFLYLFPVVGMLMLITLTAIGLRAENDLYCDHGPSDYDSYCPKCGIDS